MSIDQIRGLEWVDHNQIRRYPLAHDSTGIDVTGSWELPNSVLCGLYLPVPWDFDSDVTAFYVSKVSYNSQSLRIDVAHRTEGDVAVVTVPIDAHVGGKAYSLKGVNAFTGVTGTISIGDLADLQALPLGVYLFSNEATRLDPDTIRPDLQVVNRIVVNRSGSDSIPLSGVVNMVAGSGSRFRVDYREDGPYVIWDATGEGMKETCVCDDTAHAPITSINGIYADDSSNLSIFGSKCSIVSPVESGIRIENPCAEPCCGCRETKELQDQRQVLITQVSTLQNMVNALQSQITQLGALCATQPAISDCTANDNQ